MKRPRGSPSRKRTNTDRPFRTPATPLSRTNRDLRDLRRLIPAERSLRIFDAETQDTSYGILEIDGRPHIFDTHRKDGVHVATIEVLTEAARAVRLPPGALARFMERCEREGLLPIPYSSCFFKGNLHVYVFDGTIVGLDLAAVGGTIRDAERKLATKARGVWAHLPRRIRDAQRDLLAGRRKPRHEADLDVLVRRTGERDHLKGPSQARAR